MLLSVFNCCRVTKPLAWGVVESCESKREQLDHIVDQLQSDVDGLLCSGGLTGVTFAESCPEELCCSLLCCGCFFPTTLKCTRLPLSPPVVERILTRCVAAFEMQGSSVC